MRHKEVYAIQYISPYIEFAALNREGVLTQLKQKMVCELLETYPAMEYQNITFEVSKPEPCELPILVNHFKFIDGRYIYNGDFVSREWLEKELSQKDYKLFMRAYVVEADNEQRETDNNCPNCKYFVGCEKAIWVRGCEEYTEGEK